MALGLGGISGHHSACSIGPQKRKSYEIYTACHRQDQRKMDAAGHRGVREAPEADRTSGDHRTG